MSDVTVARPETGELDPEAQAEEARAASERAQRERTAFLAEQANIEREARENPDQPVAAFANGQWVRLSDEEKTIRLAAAEAHAARLPEMRRASAVEAIDRMADRARCRHITPSEAPIYELKRGEAARFLRDKPRDTAGFPMLAGEAKRTGKSAADIAALWSRKDAEWTAIASLIDQARMTAKEAVAAAQDKPAITAALDALRVALGRVA